MFKPYENNVVMPVITLWTNVSIPMSRHSPRRRPLETTYNDGEGDAEVVHEPPVAPKFLLVAKLRQTTLILLLDCGLPSARVGTLDVLTDGHVGVLYVLFNAAAMPSPEKVVCSVETQRYAEKNEARDVSQPSPRKVIDGVGGQMKRTLESRVFETPVLSVSSPTEAEQVRRRMGGLASQTMFCTIDIIMPTGLIKVADGGAGV